MMITCIFVFNGHDFATGTPTSLIFSFHIFKNMSLDTFAFRIRYFRYLCIWISRNSPRKYPRQYPHRQPSLPLSPLHNKRKVNRIMNPLQIRMFQAPQTLHQPPIQRKHYIINIVVEQLMGRITKW
jgi:hypothetical protein